MRTVFRMAVDTELLSVLVCPDNRSPLQVATKSVISDLNERIAAGTARTVGGNRVENPVSEGLICEGDNVLYRVQDGVPLLLVDQGIRLTG